MIADVRREPGHDSSSSQASAAAKRAKAAHGREPKAAKAGLVSRRMSLGLALTRRRAKHPTGQGACPPPSRADVLAEAKAETPVALGASRRGVASWVGSSGGLLGAAAERAYHETPAKMSFGAAAMASALKEMIGKQISVITCDGRNIVGTLRGYDQVTNVILEECHERVYSLDAGVEQVVLGLYIIRGDNIAIIGEIDPERDAKTDLSKVRAEAMKPVSHS